MRSRWTSSWVRMGVAAVTLAAVWTVGAAQPVSAQTTVDRPVTFTKDIEPILQRSCQRCHNPDSVAPMSLLTYEQVRPFARAMKQRTALRYAPWSRGVMPPWFLETNIGIQKMKDDNSLTDEQIAMIGEVGRRRRAARQPGRCAAADQAAGGWPVGARQAGPDRGVADDLHAAIASDWSGTVSASRPWA